MYWSRALPGDKLVALLERAFDERLPGLGGLVVAQQIHRIQVHDFLETDRVDIRHRLQIGVVVRVEQGDDTLRSKFSVLLPRNVKKHTGVYLIDDEPR